MYEKLLTEEEAVELYRLLGKLDKEMQNRLVESDSAFDTGEVSYTTIVRDKKRRYLKTVYDIDSEKPD